MRRHAIVMGDPAYFRIKGGRNPFTRNTWGVRKRVNLARAISQWQSLKEAFESLEVEIFVLPPDKELPGMVYPANAGFLHPKHEPIHFSRKTFCLSNLASHRLRERERYRDFFSTLGFSIATAPLPFEGEADFFPCGDFFVFTFGRLQKTGFHPHLGWPPYRYRFSHRSDERNADALQGIVGDRSIIKIRLTDTRFYHGDTCLFAFGRNREHLFAYLDAIDQESRERLRHHLGDRLIPLSREDAYRFVANSFQVDTAAGPHLVLPDGVSDAVKNKVSSLGFPFTTVDVSEFFSKGGGSIKCMLCDLGPIV